MPKFDRLTTLMERFSLDVRPASVDAATMAVTGDPVGNPLTLCFRASGVGFDTTSPVLFSAHVAWGGAANPLLAALPPLITLDLARDAEARGMVAVMLSESAAQRCGSASVVNRLAEVLVVRLLRAQIEAGSTRPGLLAGLADARLARAIVAMHDTPGRAWRNEDLARVSGLSLSRFAETFLATVGESPAAYLRRWRLTLAHQDAARGDRVDAIARRYGYGSPEGFARAFRRQFGTNPLALRALAGPSVNSADT